MKELDKLRIIALLLGASVISACESYPETTYSVDDNRISVVGVIDSDTAETLQKTLREYPDGDTLILKWVPGSVDDEASLSNLADLIRDQNLATTVPSDGVVASGGTDMFLMGNNRTIEFGACIGVHTWATGGLLGGGRVGNEVPRHDPMHELYMDFYEDVGIDPDFYWFTLSAAGPDDVHWMTSEEMLRYGMATIAAGKSLVESSEDTALRCDLRVEGLNILAAVPAGELQVEESLAFEVWMGKVITRLVEDEDYLPLPIDTDELTSFFYGLSLDVFRNELSKDVFVERVHAAFPDFEESARKLGEVMFSLL